MFIFLLQTKYLRYKMIERANKYSIYLNLFYDNNNKTKFIICIMIFNVIRYFVDTQTLILMIR